MVWVEVSRNKERPGEIHTIGEDDAYVIIDDVDTIDCYPLTAIRSMTERTESTEPLHLTEATKYDTGKPRIELIPAASIIAQARAMTYGSKKYADHNWANGFDWDRLVGSLMRHLNSWRAGEDVDPESGLNHVDHILANAGMLAAHIEEGLGNDNRRKTNS